MDFKKLFSARDVTVGRPWKRIVELALPLLIGNIAQQLYNTVDTIVVGKYVGDDALSAVGAAGPVINMIFILFIGVATGAGILVSQRFGAKDREGLSKVIGNCITLTLIACLLTTAIGLLLVLCPLFGGKDILQLMRTPEGHIYEWCRQYLIVIFIGVTGNIFYNILAGIMRGLGDSVSSLLFLLLACGLNIVLDIWFVAGLKLGVFGVALATIIAQSVSACACAFKLFRMKDLFSVTKKELMLNRQLASSILSLGLPSGITQGIFSMSALLVQSLTNSMGPTVIAANVVVMRIDGFAMLPCFSLGNSMTTYAGQNFGAKKLERLETGSRQGILVAFLTSFTLTSITLLLSRPLANIFTDTQRLIDMSVKMLRILALGYLVMGMSQTIQGFLRGVGDTKTPMWIGITTQVILRIPFAYLLARLTATEEYPNGQCEALFLSLVITWVIGFFLNLIAYSRCRKKLRANAGDDWQLVYETAEAASRSD
ncbi:MAG: MATE family efflux transporter [Oscillospiraceae bacterium]|nr:MATE family efflux transporter [Oscillospiraceae bacterium]